MSHPARPYVGRFAPSPTGDLHFGSLVAALASYLDARAHGGLWRVRVENIDPPREVPGSAERILSDLRRFGLMPDGEVLFQASRTAAYEQVTRQLLAEGKAYWCGCTRADIPASGIYPGTCREGLPPGREPRAVRLNTSGATIAFDDAIQGPVEARFDGEIGDFVIRRADQLPAYQLAVVVDDHFQQVTHVVRGADLLDSTARQVLLQRVLGLERPEYAHLPIALDPNGEKLSKRMGSDPISTLDPVDAMTAALRHLGHPPPAFATGSALMAWAVEHWALSRVPATHAGQAGAAAPRSRL